MQIVVIFGKEDTLLDKGVFTFLLTYPQNYPFEQPMLSSFVPFLHPHIYPNQKLCLPSIHPDEK
jgi:ubiquitin-protein ligase